MAMDMRRMKQEERLRKVKQFPYIEAGIALVVIMVLAALFIDTKNMNPPVSTRFAKTTAANALEFNVINVNPIIAKDFNLPNATGVLVNNVPQGSSRRLIDLRRGDIILKFNTIDVQSANHLVYLMAQSKPGDTVSFTVSRYGRVLTMSNKIPLAAGVDLFGSNGRNIFVVLVIIIITFTMLFLNLFNRTVCVTLGAVLMLVAGSVFGFYNQTEAFDAIRMSPIFIFMGMSIFAIFLEDLRFFEYVSRKMILKLKADPMKIILALCGLTFAASAFLNNISVILIVIPITIYASRGLGFNPIPVVISEVIASTIGGNTTPIGDFSNMLLATSAGLSFMDFIIFMMPICVVCLAVFLWYMWFFEFRKFRKTRSDKTKKEFLLKLKKELDAMSMDWPGIKKVLYILGACLVAFMVLPAFKIHLAPIALGGGFLLLAIENHKAKDVIKKISLTDMLFFIALFLIVGGAIYSGMLNVVSKALTAMSMGNMTLYLILLMWTTAICTSFMNAAPATAFMIPIVISSGYADFTDVVWWAINLGSIAGACACISGASAGVISQTLVEELHTARLGKDEESTLSFAGYSKRGLPISIIFLVIASLYIMFLSSFTVK
ncbi:MAG: PDZ domain-containing protein [Candidatus Omnitrophica bacterium]|nr:PDZ domain-containing protein [Candidatus Omnitrophota bacterium]